jgi:hypothetical protein
MTSRGGGRALAAATAAASLLLLPLPLDLSLCVCCYSKAHRAHSTSVYALVHGIKSYVSGAERYTLARFAATYTRRSEMITTLPVRMHMTMQKMYALHMCSTACTSVGVVKRSTALWTVHHMLYQMPNSRLISAN